MAQTLDEFQNETGAWGDATFPLSNADTVFSHLLEEFDELKAVAATIPDNPQYDEAEEVADCFILLMQFAHKKGFSLYRSAVRKMEQNRERTWKVEPEPGGHIKHDQEAIHEPA